MNLSDKIKTSFPPRIYELMLDLGSIADKNNIGAVVVGGGVRDLLLNRQFEEADFMLDFPAATSVEEFSSNHDAKLVSHERFGTFNIYFKEGLKLDVTTARQETYSAPAKLPDVTTSYDIKIKDDLKRRDFTINSMAIWINRVKFGELFDPLKGQADLEKQLVRALHSQSFLDDPTRIYRAARFAGRYGFIMEADTLVWILDSISKKVPELLTPARRRHEFELILKEENPLPALKLLAQWEALPYLHRDWTVAPEALVRFDWKQKSFIQRLGEWLDLFSTNQREMMLNELVFEKKIKKQLL